MSILWLLPAVVIASVVGTGSLRRYAISRDILDIPNERSSHSVPTPRGGGVAMVVTFLAAVGLLTGFGIVRSSMAVGLLGAGFAVALVGFIDDHRHLPASRRLLAHVLAAAWALVWLGGLPPVVVGGVPVNLGWAGHIFAAVCLVWLTNLYNFMDGIDGIAGVEAVTVCLGIALIYRWHSSAEQAWALPAVLAATALGFLVWNFPPAKIFMGDAGSGFLGLTIGILSIQAAWFAPELLWSWVILLGVFIVDATVTLLRRILIRARFVDAHRTHAYQHASQRLGRHMPVTLAVGAINLGWLLPVAVLIALRAVDGLTGTLIAYVPLVWLALRLKAGAAAAG